MIFGYGKKHHAHKAGQGTVNVNVIPMIDMLMVCNVFLLMQNSLASFAMFQSPDLVLPMSVSDTDLDQHTEIAVTERAVYVEAQLAEDALQDYMEKEDVELPGLAEKLLARREELLASGKAPDPVSPDAPAGSGWHAIIRADRRVPFKLMQKIMFTCNKHGFDRMEFAVIKDGVRTGDNGGGG